ncbi:MAG: hypothetical protein M1610_07175 [Nitrospirae bacterium]|nr:hypothetical protein [Nitrospirota bacterium]
MTENNLNFEFNKNISRNDLILSEIHAFCKRYSKWVGYGGAFLAGGFINIWSDETVTGILQLLNRMFDINYRSINILSWMALFIVTLLPAGLFLTERYARHRTYEKRLAALYQSRIDKLLQPFSAGRIGWGLGLTLQSCPDLQEGWSTKEVKIEYLPIEYMFQRNINSAYQHYLDTEFPQIYTEDKTRLMLIKNPVAFSDMKILRLEVQKTKWSQFQFYHKWISEHSQQWFQDINQVINKGQINFPNSLCLHLIIRTQDDKLFLAETSPKKGGDHHNVWALSIGEQLDPKDLEGDKDCILNWVKRALWEELGISNEDFSPENVRVMAVNFEGDINNFALATVVVLNYDSKQLDAKLNDPLKIDREFEKWAFMSCDNIPKELVKPTRNYHPSTGIRMFYAGLYEFGAPGLNRRLLDEIMK